ncbi:MAG: hypothetical protein ABI119_07485 [Gemmatimonadaceae bacterium]
MTGKTGCCGWDVWAEMAGMVYDRRTPSAEKWPGPHDHQSVPRARNPDSHHHPRTIQTAHEAAHEDR